jgi:hypothetical protein
MYWECNTDARYEGYRGYQKTGQNQRIAKTDIFPMHLFQRTSDWERWEIWYMLVEEYSTRSLTFAKDKLPALSGLASWLCTSSSDNENYMDRLRNLLLGKENGGSQKKVNYIAGLVRDDIYVGMSWATNLAENDNPDAKPSGQSPSLVLGLYRLRRSFPCTSNEGRKGCVPRR